MYDEAGSLLWEDGTGGPQSTVHVFLPGPNGPLPVAAIINGERFAVHSDHLNTPRRLTNAAGQAAWQWKYSAFGDEPATTAFNRFVDPLSSPGYGQGVVPNVAFHLRYPGQYADPESGLHYNYLRSYDAGSGRYTQPDPIGLDGGWNRFSYAELNPISRSDPLGLWSMTFEGYRGFGGGFSFGRDPKTGQGFMNFRFGWGLGGGFKWEKNGGRPGSDGVPEHCTAGGFGGGFFGDIDLNAGPLQAGWQNSLGANTGSGGYGQFMSPTWSLGDSWGYKAGGSLGGQFTVWGAK